MASPWNGRQVLVTGGTGFMGSFLVERLLEEGARVRVPVRAENFRALSDKRGKVEWVKGDLRDGEYCGEILKGIETVFHVASCRRNVEYHQKKCSDVATENVRMTTAMIDGLKSLDKKALPHVTFVSTANIPPTLDVLALAQSEHVNGYTLGKALCEALWFLASRQMGFSLLTVRPVGTYGPRDTFVDDGNVIPSLFVRARDAKDALTVWGSGEQERAFLYIEDFIDAVLKFHEKDVQGIQYVTSGDVVSVRELATLIRDLVRPGLPIVFDTEKPEGLRVIPLLPAHACLRDIAWTPIAQGLRSTFASWQASSER